jgi:ketosteroid isomerase-like protein
MEEIMNEQVNIDLVKQCYDAFNKGDIQRLLSYFAEDVDWDMPEVKPIAFSGKRHGRDEVAEFFRQMTDAQDSRGVQLQECIPQGDRVFAIGHYEFTVKATGADYGSDFVHLFTIADGKLAKFKEYADTYAAVLAYQVPAAGISKGAQAETGRPSVH